MSKRLVDDLVAVVLGVNVRCKSLRALVEQGKKSMCTELTVHSYLQLARFAPMLQLRA